MSTKGDPPGKHVPWWLHEREGLLNGIELHHAGGEQ